MPSEPPRVDLLAWVREHEARWPGTIGEMAGKQGHNQEAEFLQAAEDEPKRVEQRLDFVYYGTVCPGPLLFIWAMKGKSRRT